MKKIFPIELDVKLHRQLKHAAIDSGMTLHSWIIKILETTVSQKNLDSEIDSKICEVKLNGREYQTQKNK